VGDAGAGLGGGTAVIGVLHALMEIDLKRLLAYSTIENVGIIFVGLGLAAGVQRHGMHAAAALALISALLHAANHAQFKSLLFLGAGAVLGATGERNMERLGGLIRVMPATSFLFLVACCAISALPPFNGFASEWLILQAILLSPALPQWGLKLIVPGGRRAARARRRARRGVLRARLRITFLGRPRSPVAATAHDVDRWSVAAMAVLATLCLLAGILPGS